MPSKTLDFQLAVGRAIRARRTHLKASQTEVAKAAGLHRSNISDAERGIRNMTLETFLRIAHALNMTPSLLVRKAENAQRIFFENANSNDV